MSETPQDYSLPASIVEPGDVRRLLQEVDVMDEALRQSAIRQPEASVALPRTSHMLAELVEQNKLQLQQKADRQKLQEFLTLLLGRAPILHISFAAEPSRGFIAKITQWLRQNVHPEVLVQIGLQPSIAAGCIVRTTNKQFDFSLRQHFVSKRDVLIAELDVLAKQPATQAAPTTPVANSGVPS